MPKKHANQHRWKGWVSEKIQHDLEGAAKELKESWSIDSGDPRLYPFITEFALNDLRDRIKNRPRSTKLPPVPEGPPKAENLTDLIVEETVQAGARYRRRSLHCSSESQSYPQEMGRWK